MKISQLAVLSKLYYAAKQKMMLCKRSQQLASLLDLLCDEDVHAAFMFKYF